MVNRWRIWGYDPGPQPPTQSLLLFQGSARASHAECLTRIKYLLCTKPCAKPMTYTVLSDFPNKRVRSVLLFTPVLPTRRPKLRLFTELGEVAEVYKCSLFYKFEASQNI